MDIAIVTGAETPLGLRLIQSLVRQGCRVHGIGNNFSKVTFADPNFIAHAIDLSDLNAVTETTQKILDEEKRLHILIHAIDVTPGAAFEKLPVGNLEAVLKIGLLGPVMLTRLALPNLLRFRGQLINIIPGNKSGQPASAANALIEGGLRQMNQALFDQARDAGLRITNLILRQNTAPNSDASPEILSQSRIDPEHVARVIERLVDENDPNVPNEISLYPRLSPSAEETLPATALPVDPYSAVVLPPKEYCPPEEPKIPTKQKERIDRTIPYTDEEMEDKIAAAIEDFEAHPERYIDTPTKSQKPKGNRPQQDAQPKQTAEEDAPNPESSNDNNDDGNSNKSRRRRGRRRGGRNRNKPRPDQQGQGGQSSNEQPQNQQGSSSEAPKQREPREAEASKPQSNQNEPKAPTTQHSSENSEKRPSRNRNRRRGSKPKVEGQELPKQSAPKPETVDSPKPVAHQPKPQSEAPRTESTHTPASDAKPVAKKAAKKATKKAAKKAVKKTATKKATKKAAKKAVKKKVAKPAEE